MPDRRITPLSFKVTWAFAFLAFSKLSEFVAIGTGVNLRLLLPCGVAAIIANVANGGVIRSLLSPCGMIFTAFSAWLVICIPFSVWRGGAFVTVRDRWLIAYATFIILAGVATLPQCRQIIKALAISAVVMIAGIQVLAVQKAGRLSLQVGTFGNANDLAFNLLFGFPFMYFFLMQGRTKSIVIRLLLLAACAALALTIFQTGSRSGLLVLIATFLVVFWRIPLTAKVGVVAVGTILVAAGLSVATRTAVDRLRTLIADEDEITSGSMAEATASREARMDLLMESLRLTLANPVFGVGPGMYPVATGWRWTEGIGMGWRETHNTYTEVSSETGIPGLALFLAVILWCVRRLIAIRRLTRRRPHLQEIDDTAFCLLLSLFVYCLNGFFSSMTYHTTLPMLAGLITAFDFATRQELSVPAMAIMRQPSVQRLPVRV